MMQSMDCRRGVLLVLLDTSAAFDSIDHDRTPSSSVHLVRLHPPSILCGSVAQLKPTVGDIGVVLDTRLDMASKVSSVCRSAYYHLFRIAKIRASLTTVACNTLLHALVIYLVSITETRYYVSSLTVCCTAWR